MAYLPLNTDIDGTISLDADGDGLASVPIDGAIDAIYITIPEEQAAATVVVTDERTGTELADVTGEAIHAVPFRKLATDKDKVALDGVYLPHVMTGRNLTITVSGGEEGEDAIAYLIQLIGVR